METPKLFVVLGGRVLDGERPDELPEELAEALEGHDAEVVPAKLFSVHLCSASMPGTLISHRFPKAFWKPCESWPWTSGVYHGH